MSKHTIKVGWMHKLPYVQVWRRICKHGKRITIILYTYIFSGDLVYMLNIHSHKYCYETHEASVLVLLFITTSYIQHVSINICICSNGDVHLSRTYQENICLL